MRRPFVVVAIAALLAPVGTHAEDLEISFNDHCRECHSFLKDDNRLGPSLYGVVGRKAGTEPGYNYTQSMKDSGVTWTPATLDKWIADPGAVIPGNGMSPPYSGITDAAIRERIVAFLKSISPEN
ncbi:MAG: c-type cytochrome [Hyphomicrobium sp.]|jgi:cytochrome c